MPRVGAWGLGGQVEKYVRCKCSHKGYVVTSQLARMQNFSLRRGVPLCGREGVCERNRCYLPTKSGKIEGLQFPRPGSLSEAEFDADHEYVISFLKISSETFEFAPFSEKRCSVILWYGKRYFAFCAKRRAYPA